MHLCNRVDRRSKSQNISELAFSLNRYHNSATPLFYSETQSDISFLIILCKDSHTHAKKANFSAFSYMKLLFFQLPSAQPRHFLGMHRRFLRLHFLFPYLHFISSCPIFFTICAEKVYYKVCNTCYKLSNTCYKLCNICYKLCNKKFLIGQKKISGRKEKIDWGKEKVAATKTIL